MRGLYYLVAIIHKTSKVMAVAPPPTNIPFPQAAISVIVYQLPFEAWPTPSYLLR